MIKLTIGEYIRLTDIYTWYQLRILLKQGIQKPNKEIKLGDKPENLMKADSYTRVGRRVRQRSWG